MKKRAHGLPAELFPQEIVIVLRTEIIKSFLDVVFAQAALARRGWNPYNRATLDDPQILVTATDELQKERDIVLHSCIIDNSSTAPALPTQRDLLMTGSGHFAGGAAAALEESVGELNYTGCTANKIITLMQNAKSKNEGRREHMAEDAAMENRLTLEELQKQYKEANCFTAGTVLSVLRS